MKKTFCIYLLFALLFSCSDEIQIKPDIEEPEYIPQENKLTEEEAVNVLYSYFGDNNQLKTTASSVNVLSCKSKKASDYGDKSLVNSLKTKSAAVQNAVEEIPIYEFTITEGGYQNGFALVVGDRRFDEVIAYAPIGSLADTIFNDGLRIFTSSIPEIVARIPEQEEEFIKSRTKADYYQPEISGTYYLDSEYGKLVSTLYSEAEFKKEWSRLVVSSANYIYAGPWDEFVSPCCFVAVQWDQTSPYNDKVTVPCGTHKAKVGCSVVAIAQIMAYHRQPVSYNWTLLKSKNIIKPIIENYANGSCTEVSRLMIDVARAAETVHTCNKPGGAGSTPSRNMVPAFEKLGYSAHYAYSYRDKVSVDSLYQNFIKRQPVVMECADIYASTGERIGAHAWVSDGLYKKSRNRYKYYHAYGWGPEYWEIYKWRENFAQSHNNWGWGGSSDGWYYAYTPVNEGYKFKKFGMFTQIKYKGK